MMYMLRRGGASLLFHIGLGPKKKRSWRLAEGHAEGMTVVGSRPDGGGRRYSTGM